MASKKPNQTRLDQVVAQAQRDREQREQGYRERALKMYPWICGRCSREFNRSNVQELTVHHRDHNHDNNPSDGSNWELLCIYCHDNEHAKYIEQAQYGSAASTASAQSASQSSFKPFENLKDLLKKE